MFLSVTPVILIVVSAVVSLLAQEKIPLNKKIRNFFYQLQNLCD